MSTQNPHAALAQQLREEVVALLEEVPPFEAGEGCYVSGRLAAVEFVARRRGDGGADLLFRIVPHVPVESPDDAPLDAKAAAFEQLLGHDDPRVRELAQLQLDRLRGPRLDARSLAGLRLEVEVVLGRQSRTRSTSTDVRGRACLEGVALRSECRIVLASFSAVPHEAQPAARTTSGKS